jgi:hypothetical protein
VLLTLLGAGLAAALAAILIIATTALRHAVGG